MSTEPETTETDELTRLPQTLEGALKTLGLQQTLLDSQRELIQSQSRENVALTERLDAANTRTKWALIALAIADGCIGFLLVLLVFVFKHDGFI